jgi:hypothetical protein
MGDFGRRWKIYGLPVVSLFSVFFFFFLVVVVLPSVFA